MVRIAVIEKDKCHPDKCGNYLCIRLCPINRTGDECIVKGPDAKAQINVELCTGCGICPKRCPFGTIHIINLPEELKHDPIHRYGINGFHLYNLPTPVFGKVVGIIGKNGIGKSTAMKILGGLLQPNLGNQDKEATYEDLIKYFKGTETQTFFEKLRKGEIKISYKPQQVDLIPKATKGKIQDLLRKQDEKGAFDQIVEELDLKDILDRDIENISGGELQRVAIAATVLKKANLYLFDEPTSFLDIKQRIKVSRFIKNLADENTAVMVIEHDLIILDYMTDLMHIMYGKEAVYGIVSHPKSTKEGINIYLSGYSRDENVMFRDKSIKFEAKAPMVHKGTAVLTSWANIRKKLGAFTIDAEKGEVAKDDVIGILGENGIGKTSFVRILAGVDKADSGEVSAEVKVAYKPQYIDTTSEKRVSEVLQEAILKYENQIIKPLSIAPLMEKKVSQLSGGELQRVAIALTLGRKADLYLFDEPSAYLDVEQRLLVSKIIRDVMEERGTTALIVDHDLLFLDYLSTKLMVFDGKPAVHGVARGPFAMEQGMNHFLTDLEISLRRDKETGRPRVNKPGSVKDREQKGKGRLYYM